MGEQFRCSICDRTWDEIPPDAVQVSTVHGPFRMYRFADGITHRIGSTKLGRKKKTVETVEEKHP